MAWHNGEWYDDGSTFVYVHDWCPECQPEGAPDPWILKPCAIHVPYPKGDADPPYSFSFWMSGSADVESSGNSAWCRMIHRQPEDAT